LETVTTQNGGRIRATRFPLRTAIHTAAGSGVPTSWNRRAKIDPAGYRRRNDRCGNSKVVVLGCSYRSSQAIAPGLGGLRPFPADHRSFPSSASLPKTKPTGSHPRCRRGLGLSRLREGGPRNGPLECLPIVSAYTHVTNDRRPT
jgi:hypothetical protein